MNLEERIKVCRKYVEKAYMALQTGNPDEMANTATELAMQMYGLAGEIADLQFDADTLESVYKNKTAQAFGEFKDSGLTDKLSDSKARLKWAEMKDQHIKKNRDYKLAKLTHDDLGNLVDVLRTNISIKKVEIQNIRSQV